MTENKLTIGKIKTKTLQFFEKSKAIDKYLAVLTKKTEMTNLTNERDTTTNSKDIKRIPKNHKSMLIDQMNQFLERHELTKFK